MKPDGTLEDLQDIAAHEPKWLDRNTISGSVGLLVALKKLNTPDLKQKRLAATGKAQAPQKRNQG